MSSLLTPLDKLKQPYKPLSLPKAKSLLHSSEPHKRKVELDECDTEDHVQIKSKSAPKKAFSIAKTDYGQSASVELRNACTSQSSQKAYWTVSQP